MAEVRVDCVMCKYTINPCSPCLTEPTYIPLHGGGEATNNNRKLLLKKGLLMRRKPSYFLPVDETQAVSPAAGGGEEEKLKNRLITAAGWSPSPKKKSLRARFQQAAGTVVGAVVQVDSPIRSTLG